MFGGFIGLIGSLYEFNLVRAEIRMLTASNKITGFYCTLVVSSQDSYSEQSKIYFSLTCSIVEMNAAFIFLFCTLHSIDVKKYSFNRKRVKAGYVRIFCPFWEDK